MLVYVWQTSVAPLVLSNQAVTAPSPQWTWNESAAPNTVAQTSWGIQPWLSIVSTMIWGCGRPKSTRIASESWHPKMVSFTTRLTG